MEEKEESLKDKLDKLIEITTNEKQKKFKMPLGIRMFAKSKTKKDYVIVGIVEINLKRWRNHE